MMNNERRKKKRIVEANQDYISSLPTNILCNILSSLKTREAVKTSVLSSKWRHIYTNPTNLVFDAENILAARDSSATNNTFHHLSEVLRFEIRLNRTRKFVSIVKQYLSRVENVQKIGKLKVLFTFCHKGYGCKDLDDWIRFAVRRNVEEIDLCMLEENHQQQLSAPNPNDCGSLYVFPCDIVCNEGFKFKSFLKCLRLAHCVLAPHMPYNFGFGTLTTLELLKVDMKSEEHIRILLSCCNNLEWLSFSECYNMYCIKVVHPLCQKLKYLNVNLCRKLKAIEIHSTTLETLEYIGDKIDFFFDTPRLKTIFTHVRPNREILLSIDLTQLETVFLEYTCYMGEVMTNKFPTLPKLRHLGVIKVGIFRQDLWWIETALKACPKLARLDLHLRTYFHIDEELRTSWPPNCQHNHLKKVAITGISGHSSEIEIAIYLLKNSVALEKMTVDPRPRIYLGNGKWNQSEACENWSRVGRQKVYMHLMQEINSQVKLLIL